MPEDKRVRYVVAELPLSVGKLGTGGLRREDGTVAALVRNPRDLDDAALAELVGPSVVPLSPGRQLAVGIGSQVVDFMLREVVVPGATWLWTEQVTPAARRKLQERRDRKAARRDLQSSDAIEAESIPDASAPDDEIDARDEPTIELTREEAERLVELAQRAARQLGEHLAILRAARIVDDEDIPALLEGRGQLEVGSTDSVETDGNKATGAEPQSVFRREGSMVESTSDHARQRGVENTADDGETP